MKKKEVLHVAEAFGGGIIEFVRYLTLIDEVNHTVLYSEREISIDKIADSFSSNVTFIKWENAQRKISFNKDIKSYFFLKKVIKNKNYDVIHLHSSKAGFIGRVFSFFNPKIGHVLYTPNGASFARKDISKLTKLLYIMLEYIGSRLGGKVVCVSKSEAELFKSVCIKAQFINNGILIKDDITRVEHDSKKIRIVTIGRISLQKNPLMFNQIANFFVANPNIDFYWIGDGELRKELTAKNITVTGWIDKESIFRLLSESQIYVSTALWEGLPFAVLEAMNFSLSLVLKDCIGNQDLVKDNGLLFKDEKQAVEYINILINTRDKMKEEGMASLRLLKDSFSVTNMKQNYLNLYLNEKVV